jgi:oxygen-independent coproporphyrinogen-3 oxidase
VNEYIKAFEKRDSPIALSIHLSEEMQMAGWLYWRIYETKFKKRDFEYRFKTSFDKKYGIYIKILNQIGFLKNDDYQITFTDKGTYWIHAFEDFFSIDYINKLWGTSKTNPWPEKIVL